jgi:hypothetical protein
VHYHMSTTKRNPQTVVLDPTLAEEVDGVANSEYADNETFSAFSDDVVAPACPTCGDLLAWHEEPCSAPGTEPASNLQVATLEAAPASLPGAPVSGFTYALGQPVQPAPATQAGKVIWRGQVKERHPRTGLLHRVNVYRLDNGYWDCYYEAELQAA